MDAELAAEDLGMTPQEVELHKFTLRPEAAVRGCWQPLRYRESSDVRRNMVRHGILRPGSANRPLRLGRRSRVDHPRSVNAQWSVAQDGPVPPVGRVIAQPASRRANDYKIVAVVAIVGQR